MPDIRLAVAQTAVSPGRLVRVLRAHPALDGEQRVHIAATEHAGVERLLDFGTRRDTPVLRQHDRRRSLRPVGHERKRSTDGDLLGVTRRSEESRDRPPSSGRVRTIA